jgi:stearoyl-CoA desaturase (delta-9 desaturase)
VSALARTLRLWIDTGAEPGPATTRQGIDVLRVVPFIALHAACFAVLWVGWSTTAVAVAAALYAARMFAITAFYHRYLAHRAFKTSRAAQLAFALLAASAVQRGPLWWAAHHRHHHASSDRPGDPHSPAQHGFVWSHLGWFLARENFATKLELVRDWSAYAELRWLDRFDAVVPLVLAGSLYAAGEALARWAPALGTDGPQLLVWGFVVSTVALYHATFTINSLAHRLGTRRYATRDSSRNNLTLALLTFGEGWHNNHHRYPGAARQGFFWWEVDVTYYALRALAALGVVWDLRPVPAAVRDVERAP